VSAALQALARALPGREVYLRAVVPAFGKSSFTVVVVDGAGSRYRVTLTGLPATSEDEAIRSIAEELLRERHDLLSDSEKRSLQGVVAALAEAP
jgi:hypothetical protein